MLITEPFCGYGISTIWIYSFTNIYAKHMLQSLSWINNKKIVHKIQRTFGPVFSTISYTQILTDLILHVISYTIIDANFDMLTPNEIYKTSWKKKIILRQKFNCSLGSSLCHGLHSAILFFHSTIAKYMNLRKKINGPILQRRHLSLHLDFIFNINNPLISCHYSNCESCRPTIMWQACHKNKKAI